MQEVKPTEDYGQRQKVRISLPKVGHTSQVEVFADNLPLRLDFRGKTYVILPTKHGKLVMR